MKDYDGALEDYKLALEIDPKSSKSYNGIALIYME